MSFTVNQFITSSIISSPSPLFAVWIVHPIKQMRVHLAKAIVRLLFNLQQPKVMKDFYRVAFNFTMDNTIIIQCDMKTSSYKSLNRIFDVGWILSHHDNVQVIYFFSLSSFQFSMIWWENENKHNKIECVGYQHYLWFMIKISSFDLKVVFFYIRVLVWRLRWW